MRLAILSLAAFIASCSGSASDRSAPLQHPFDAFVDIGGVSLQYRDWGGDRLIDRQAEFGVATEMLRPGAHWQSRVRATATDPLYRQYLASLVGTSSVYTDGLRALRERATEIVALLRARDRGGL